MTAAGQQIVDGTPPPAPADGTAAPARAGDAPAGIAIDIREAEQFLYREARLADTHDLDAWEALWTDDALYHVPVDEHADPFTHMSIVFDNRSRIATRIKQLQTGRRHAQRPRSRVVRSVSNVEIVGVESGVEGGVDGGDTVVASVVWIVESRDRDTRHVAGRVTHKLRRIEGPDGPELRMALKKVVLVDADRALRSLSFLI